MKGWLVVLILIGSIATKSGHASMFNAAATAWGVPSEWIRAIAQVESGGQPWSLNIEGQGYRFDSKKEALEKASEAQAQGKSFDSGIMQVNNFWLDKYNIPLERAFDPVANIHLGARILKQEIDRHGMNWTAVGAYHSPTKARSKKYAVMVKRALGKGGQPVHVSAHPQPADYSPLVVSRRTDNHIGRPGQRFANALPFVQRSIKLNKGQ